MSVEPPSARVHRPSAGSEITRLLQTLTFEEKLAQLTAVALPADDDERALPGPVPGVVLVPRLPEVEAQRRIAALHRRTAGARVAPLTVAVNGMFGDLQPVGRAGAASWDRQLTEQVAELAARRLRAVGILGTVGHVGPSATTDPALAAGLAEALVRGAQGAPAGRAGRIRADRIAVGVAPIGPAVDGDWHERTLRTDVLAGVESAVAAGAAMVVPSTAANAGIPAHADSWLLQELLRAEWGFAGMVLAAPDGVVGLTDVHRVAESTGGALALALESGVDVVAQGEDSRRLLGRLVAGGDLPAWLVDDAVAAVLQVKHRLGLLDEDVDGNRPRPDPEAVRELGLLRGRAVEQSLVLVADPAEALPLRALQTVTVTSVDPHPGADVTAMVRALTAALPDVEVRASDDPRAADVVVVLATDPGAAAAPAARVVASGRRCVVLVCGDRLDGLAALSTTMASIVVCWSRVAPRADVIAEVLAGRSEPGGRLPRAVRAPRPDAGPVFPLGHGRGYTTFRFSALELAPRTLLATETLAVHCRVTNTGRRTGREVVQVYLRPLTRSVSASAPVLAGFAAVVLAPGHSATVTVRIPPRHLAVWDRAMRHVVEPGSVDVLVGVSAQDIRLRGTVSVSSMTMLSARTGPGWADRARTGDAS